MFALCQLKKDPPRVVEYKRHEEEENPKDVKKRPKKEAKRPKEQRERFSTQKQRSKEKAQQKEEKHTQEEQRENEPFDKDKAFFNASTPSERAKLDLDRFLSLYFLTDDGKPDRSKTPKGLVITGYPDRRLLYATVASIPGLGTNDDEDDDEEGDCSDRHNGGAHTIYIGWIRQDPFTMESGSSEDIEEEAREYDREKEATM